MTALLVFFYLGSKIVKSHVTNQLLMRQLNLYYQPRDLATLYFNTNPKSRALNKCFYDLRLFTYVSPGVFGE